MECIGRHLEWHGGLSIDYIVDSHSEPKYIDSNPRLAETGNALAARVNLLKLLVEVSMGQSPPTLRAETLGIRSFTGIQGLLRTARDSSSRWQIIRTIIDLASRRGVFAHGAEELTPLTADARAVIPIAAVAGLLLIKPSRWEQLSLATVNAYAATPQVVQFVNH
jgi:hypothetical protein